MELPTTLNIAKTGDDLTVKEAERRRYPRIFGRFVVSCRLLDKADVLEVSQTKNLSLGGLALTTNINFEPGTKLSLKVRIPLEREPVEITGRVVESREIVKKLYNTRIEFVTVDEKYRESLMKTVTHYLKK